MIREAIKIVKIEIKNNGCDIIEQMVVVPLTEQITFNITVVSNKYGLLEYDFKGLVEIINSKKVENFFNMFTEICSFIQQELRAKKVELEVVMGLKKDDYINNNQRDNPSSFSVKIVATDKTIKTILKD